MDLTNTLILHISLIIVCGAWYYFVCCKHLNKDGDNLPHAVSSSLSALLSPKWLPIIIVAAGFCCQIFVSSILLILHDFIPEAFVSYDKLVETANGEETPLLLILCICLLAPFGEELLFRGVLLFHAKRMFGVPCAIILQGILFGIYHGNVVQGIYAGFMGILLGVVAYKRQSIVPSILLHLTVNVSLYLIPSGLFSNIYITYFLFILSGSLLAICVRKI